MIKFFFILIIVAIFMVAGTGVLGDRTSTTTIPLSTANNFDWTYINSNKSISGKATVPGDIFGDLEAAGIIGNINYRYTNDEIVWAALENWTYTTSFDFPSEFQSNYNTFPTQIVFDSIRLAANIYINDVHVGETHDQFYKHEFLLPVAALKPRQNQLKVVFNSTVTYARDQALNYPVTPLPDAPAYIDEYPFRNFVRTEQSSFAWDWGTKSAQVSLISTPKLVLFAASASSSTKNSKQNSDILSSIKSSPTKTVMHIDYVTPHIFSLPFGQPTTQPLNDSSNSFLVDTYVYVTCWGQECFKDGSFVSIAIPSATNIQNSSSTWTFYDDEEPAGVPNPNKPICTSSLNKKVTPTPNTEPISPFSKPTIFCKAYTRIQLTVKNAKLWWPRNVLDEPYPNVVNEQPPNVGFQYTLTATLYDQKKSTILDASFKKIGFRSIELVTKGDPLDYGLPKPNPPLDVMFFRVNGVPVFAKGANLIPFDALPSKITRGVMEQILSSAERANMNIIRVWGGGIYQPDEFYDLASERGILIWQEQIFACAAYPINPGFLQDVRKELRHQLRRLGHQASIVLWSGNNENQQPYDHGPDSPYEILNDDTVMAEIIKQDTSRPIWPASPSQGWKSGVTQSGLPSGTMEKPSPFETCTGDNTSDCTIGDSHWYNYFNCPNISVFPRTNFASEFGFQSLPFFDELQNISLPQDWSLFSDFMNRRQHHPNGNEEIALLIEKNFGTSPSFWNQSGVAVFKKAIFLSQLQQTLCISEEAAFYRRMRDSEFRTMGEMYWQLNQNWVAPSWTSIEHSGEWKLLHYAMSKVYRKIFVSAFINDTDGSAHAHVASDMLNISRCTAGLEVYLIPMSVTASATKPFGILPFLIDRKSFLYILPLRGVHAWNAADWKKTIIEANPDRCPTPAYCFLYFRLNCSDVLFSNNPLTPTPLFLAPFAEMSEKNVIPKTTITVEYIETSLQTGEVVLQVSATATALYTFLHPPKPYNVQGSFNINGFVVIPGVSQRVSFTCLNFDGNTCDVSQINGEAFASGIVVETLNDNAV